MPFQNSIAPSVTMKDGNLNRSVMAPLVTQMATPINRAAGAANQAERPASTSRHINTAVKA